MTDDSKSSHSQDTEAGSGKESDSAPVAGKLDTAFSQLEKKQAAPSSAGRSSGIGGGLAIFLALVAIGVAAYPAYETWRRLLAPAVEEPDQTAIELAALRSRVAQMDSALGSVDQKLADLAAEAGVSDSKLADIRAYLAGELADIRGRSGVSARDWIYAEVEYLVRMANQRVLMEGDAVSALHLLQSADDIIREAEGLTAHELRRALAQDIAALKAINPPDTQGIYLELSALINQVNSLKRIVPAYEPPMTDTRVASAEAGWWGRLLTLAADAGSRLGRLVDFRRGGIEVQPMLPPKEEYYLRQNLVLKLQMAQLALLKGDDRVYRSSLAEASTWVADAFVPEDAASVAMQEGLSRLSEISVEVVLPDISHSLMAVRAKVDVPDGAGVQ